MKIDPYFLKGLTSQTTTKSKVSQGHFADLLKKALAKGESQGVTAATDGPVAFPERPLKLAGEVLSLLEELPHGSKEGLLARLEEGSRALAQELSQVPEAGSGRRLLEEVALLGVVEAAKGRQGRYS